MATRGGKECSNEEPAVNLKCIVFTIALVTGYWLLPPRNKWVLAGLLYFPYLAMAHYDYRYACKRNLGATYLAMFYEPLKPPESKQIKIYRNWCSRIKRKVILVDVVVAAIVAIIFWFWFRTWTPSPPVGYMKR